MSYNPTTGIISVTSANDGVSVRDVQRCVPVSLQRTNTSTGQVERIVSGDIGVVCSAVVGDTITASDGKGNWTVVSRTPINKWAKYKPVRTPVIDTVTGQWNKSQHRWNIAGDSGVQSAHWWKNTTPGSATQGGTAVGSCGMKIEYFESFGTTSSTNSFLYKLLNNLLDWVYERPTGASSSPLRIQDFADYFHLAEQPFGSIGHDVYHYDDTNGVEFNWDVTGTSVSYNRNLQLSDFQIDGASLSSYHLGVVLKDGNITKSFISTGTIGSDNLTISTGLDQSLWQKGSDSYRKWQVIPFLSLGTSTGSSGRFISMAGEGITEITIMKNGSLYLAIETASFTSSTKISYTIAGHNETSSNRTVDIYVEIRKLPVSSSLDPSQGTDVYHTTLASRTLTRLTTTNIEVTNQTLNYENGYMYWIYARILDISDSETGYEQMDVEFMSD